MYVIVYGWALVFNSCVLFKTNPVGCFLWNSTGWRLQPTRYSRTLVSPPPMSSRHRILEPSGRWHATLTLRNSNLQHTNLKWAAAATTTYGHTIQYYQLSFFLHLIIITSTFTHLYVAWVKANQNKNSDSSSVHPCSKDHWNSLMTSTSRNIAVWITGHQISCLFGEATPHSSSRLHPCPFPLLIML